MTPAVQECALSGIALDYARICSTGRERMLAF
jgi:hypothetical protein